MSVNLQDPKSPAKIISAATYSDRTQNTKMISLWQFRELIWTMVKRDLLGRYRGSLLGSFWPLINPAGHLLLYTFLFSIVLKVRFGHSASTSNFALYLMTGLIPWGAFAESVARSTTVILECPNLVKRVVFPLEILPLISVISSFASQMLALIILFVGATIYFGTVHLSIIYLPVITFSLLLITGGISWMLASLGVFLRDTKHFMSLGLAAWMYATPIVYPESALPSTFQWLTWVNPLSGVVSDYRRALLEGLPPCWGHFATYTLFGLFVWFVGFWFFVKTKKSFIDIM